MDAESFKKTIRGLVSQEYQIEFLGDNFDKTVQLLSSLKADEIYRWVKMAVSKEIQPIIARSNKKYKKWDIHQLLSFRKEMDIEGVSYRIMLLKVKNSFYIEFHLGQHSYYDKLRNRLGLTRKKY